MKLVTFFPFPSRSLKRQRLAEWELDWNHLSGAEVAWMAFIYVACEHGHRLKANHSLSGKTLSCPVCRLSVTVPPQHEPLSDTGVMRILGDVPPLPPSPEPLRSRLRPCPRCGVLVRNELTVCTGCQGYIGHPPDYMKQLR